MLSAQLLSVYDKKGDGLARNLCDFRQMTLP